MPELCALSQTGNVSAVINVRSGRLVGNLNVTRYREEQLLTGQGVAGGVSVLCAMGHRNGGAGRPRDVGLVWKERAGAGGRGICMAIDGWNCSLCWDILHSTTSVPVQDQALSEGFGCWPFPGKLSLTMTRTPSMELAACWGRNKGSFPAASQHGTPH